MNDGRQIQETQKGHNNGRSGDDEHLDVPEGRNLKKKKTAYSHVFLLAIEAHADVVPEWAALWGLLCCYSVLGEGNIKVSM